MRALTNEEVRQVSGGIGVVGAVIGATTSGLNAYMNDKPAGQIVGTALLGSVAGFFSGISSAASGFGRLAFGTYAVGTGYLAGEAGSGS